MAPDTTSLTMTRQPREGRSRASTVHNADIAAAFDEIADLLAIENANPFRIRAYRNAARIVAGLPTEAAVMVERGDDLTTLRGIGEDLALTIADLALTGTTPLLVKLRTETPSVLIELLHLPGLGPRRAKALHDELGVETVSQLHRALKDGRVARLPGFGEKLAQRLLRTVEAKATVPGRMKLAIAAQYGEPLLGYVRELPGVHGATIAGSYRRARETVGDLDIVVAAKHGAPVVDSFVRYPEVARVIVHGSTRSTVMLRSGLHVDICVVPPESYGSALVYFTGSKAHNIAIRRLAQDQGLKISEYGVFRGSRWLAGETEESVYRAIGLPLIAPELREDRGEIEAAREGRLPDLVELKDLRGDLHAHTTATDGRNSLREMALGAKAFGYEYLAITEHSRHLSVAPGLDVSRLSRQIDQLDLPDARCRMAKDMGVLVSINTDAHAVADCANLRFGVGQARRGWLSKDDVLNTRSLSDLRSLLVRAKRR